MNRYYTSTGAAAGSHFPLTDKWHYNNRKEEMSAQQSGAVSTL